MKFKGLSRFFLVLLFVIIVTYLASNFIGLSRGGFDAEEILRLQSFYLVGGIFAVGLMVAKLYEVSNKKGDYQYGKSVGFASQGEKPHLSFFKRFTTPQLFLLSIIIFGSLGFLNMTLTSQRTYTGVGILKSQQFTQTDSILYSTLLIPGAENLGAALMFALVLVAVGIWARKSNFSSGNYIIAAMVFPAISLGLFGLGNHLLRYRGFEAALFVVFLFWTFGGILTSLIGSFIPFWVMHIMNNLFYDLGRTYSSEQLLVWVIIGLILITLSYFLIYRGRLLGGKIENE